MDFKENYKNWCSKVKYPILQNELASIATDEEEIFSRFGSFLEFGTAGVRGLVGVGSNRINFITIAHISDAFSTYLVENFHNPSVVISYDTRRFSHEFAIIAAEVFAYHDIKVHFFGSPRPIGLLSFAIRNLKCSGGVMITASHNPAEYNGYKIYDDSGAQPVDVSDISEKLKKIDIFGVKKIDFKKGIEKGKIQLISEKVKLNYINYIKNGIDFKKLENLKITYSPLNGCAGDLFCSLFAETKNLNIVKEQSCLDENFSTCRNPDPQKLESFKYATILAKSSKSDIVILNDPDGDRIGISLKYSNGYVVISCIELAALLLDFIAKNYDISNSIIAKSVVTGGLVTAIANSYGVQCYETLPGFKYIADFMNKLETSENLNSFLFGFEESNGILLLNDLRDKDGISSSAFICNMVSYYKNIGINCLDILDEMYHKFGYHSQKNISIVEKDKKKINSRMHKFKEYFMNHRENVDSIIDYRLNEKISFNSKTVSKIGLPYANMICVNFESNNKIFVRSSGTEPLLKYYIIYNGKTQIEATNICQRIEDLINNF